MNSLLVWKTLGSPYIDIQSVYIQCNNIATANCIDVFLIKLSWQGEYDEYCLKNVIFLSGFSIKSIRWWNGRRDVIPPHSFVYGPAFTHLCVISYQCNASESDFKENLGIQHILIHQKASNLENSLLLA